ncbi:hypothetical protein HYALB_00010745 [Hymenoscyphus albidus]|uniref:Uncharacterized protein n=1 Tax=Hymenoscyphus albidus TaxID=595503 RepID=A0A9N9LLR1_9HELO|nr:hypothetical protein HYALB_00010745 [Hymenoscyphus albidus]
MDVDKRYTDEWKALIKAFEQKSGEAWEKYQEQRANGTDVNQLLQTARKWEDRLGEAIETRSEEQTAYFAAMHELFQLEDGEILEDDPDYDREMKRYNGHEYWLKKVHKWRGDWSDEVKANEALTKEGKTPERNAATEKWAEEGDVDMEEDDE